MENLLGVVVGGILAAVAGFIGHRLSKLTEQEQWLRDRKLETYVGLIDALHRIHHDNLSQHEAKEAKTPLPQQPISVHMEWVRDVHLHLSRLTLLAPLKLSSMATDAYREISLMNRASKEGGDFETAFRSANDALGRFQADARLDLGVSDHGAASAPADSLSRFAARNLPR